MTGGAYSQDGYRLRFAWGLDGAQEVVAGAALVAVVDVLSFTTTLTVATDRGVEVMPYRWRDSSARVFARERGAVLAVARSEAGPGEVSLSPGTVRAAPALRRVVLPSPNGSTIAHTAGTEARAVIGVSLRNTTAASTWALRRIRRDPAAWVAVVAAGELRTDGTPRPAAEDLWGAGGFLAALTEGGTGPASPEASSAIGAYRAVRNRLPELLRDCASGRELADAGYGEDVDVAAELDASESVPELRGNSFHGAHPGP